MFSVQWAGNIKARGTDPAIPSGHGGRNRGSLGPTCPVRDRPIQPILGNRQHPYRNGPFQAGITVVAAAAAPKTTIKAAPDGRLIPHGFVRRINAGKAAPENCRKEEA